MNKKIVAAYCAHGGINAVTDATLEKLDIIYFAFGAVKGTDISFGYPEDLIRAGEIKAKHPNIKVILCIGGGGAGQAMTDATLKEEDFQAVTQNMFEAMVDNGFDGIDLDWEFPTTTGHPEEQQKHTEMLRLLREKLDTLPDYHTLSVACPDGGWTFRITELDKSHIYLDYINAMTYDMTDFHFTSHHTAPYSSTKGGNYTARSVKNSIDIFKAKGIPPEKIIVGAAFYSKKWSGITGGENGLAAATEAPVAYGPGITALEEEYINKNGFRRYWDETACAPYLYNGDTFITYDDEESIKKKCELILEEDIGGIMVWELGGDRKQTLLPLMRKWLGNR